MKPKYILILVTEGDSRFECDSLRVSPALSFKMRKTSSDGVSFQKNLDVQTPGLGNLKWISQALLGKHIGYKN